MAVAILGSGLSGIMAAWACLQHGENPILLSDKPPEVMEAPVFLHEQCDLPLSPLLMRSKNLGVGQFELVDLQKMYALKVYGRVRPVSFGSIKNEVLCIWSAESAIDFVGKLVDWDYLKVTSFLDVEKLWDRDMRVISTIPVNVLYPTFLTPIVEVHVAKSYDDSGDNYIVYNPFPNPPWYRVTCLNGVVWTESTTGFQESKIIHKVDSETKYVSPDSSLLLVGRYGAWDKNALAHTVYKDVLEWLKN